MFTPIQSAKNKSHVIRLILIKAYRFKFVFSFKTFNLHENDIVWYIHSANPNPSWDTYCFPSLYFTRCQHKNISAWLPQFCDLSSRFLLCELQKNKQTKVITEDWLLELKWTPPPPTLFLCVNNTKPVRRFFPKCRKKWPLEWPQEKELKQTFLGDDICWGILNSRSLFSKSI